MDKTGFSDNYWTGLALLHTLFVKEHNSICDFLRGINPSWDDERLFLTARLVNSALMAKIHTVEWTPGILANPVLERAMHANWYGLLPKWVRQKFGHLGTEMIGGVVGSPQQHHAAPYSITEEFISVYRLHPLLPDDYEIRDHRNGQLLGETDFDPIQGAHTRGFMDEWGLSNLMYSFGTAHPGAITLHNHPRALQNHVRITGDRVDLGTIDILRDRERGVARYNDFREKLRMPPRGAVRDLTDNAQWAQEIRDVYDGDIDRVDLLVGCSPSRCRPASASATRRSGSSSSWRRAGCAAIASSPTTTRRTCTAGGPGVGREHDDEGRTARHHPELAPALEGVDNAFAPWRKLLSQARQMPWRANCQVPAWPRTRASTRSSWCPTPCRASSSAARAGEGRHEAGIDGRAVRLLAGAAQPRPRPVWVRVLGSRAAGAVQRGRPQVLGGSPDPFASTPTPSERAWSPSSPTRSRSRAAVSGRAAALTEAVLDTGKPPHRHHRDRNGHRQPPPPRRNCGIRPPVWRSGGPVRPTGVSAVRVMCGPDAVPATATGRRARRKRFEARQVVGVEVVDAGGEQFAPQRVARRARRGRAWPRSGRAARGRARRRRCARSVCPLGGGESGRRRAR